MVSGRDYMQAQSINSTNLDISTDSYSDNNTSIKSIKLTCTTALETRGWTTWSTWSNFINSNDPKLIVCKGNEMQNNRVQVSWIG